MLFLPESWANEGRRGACPESWGGTSDVASGVLPLAHSCILDRYHVDRRDALGRRSRAKLERRVTWQGRPRGCEIVTTGAGSVSLRLSPTVERTPSPLVLTRIFRGPAPDPWKRRPGSCERFIPFYSEAWSAIHSKRWTLPWAPTSQNPTKPTRPRGGDQGSSANESGAGECCVSRPQPHTPSWS